MGHKYQRSRNIHVSVRYKALSHTALSLDIVRMPPDSYAPQNTFAPESPRLPANMTRPEGQAREYFGRGPRFHFYSPRLRAPVAGSGDLRLDHLIRLECDPEVICYEPFPILTAEIPGAKEPLVGDSLVQFRRSGLVLHTLAMRSNPITPCRAFAGERSWAKSHDCSHVMITADDIRQPDKHLLNCYLLFPWLGELHQPEPDESRSVLGALLLQPAPVTIASLAGSAKCPLETTVAVVVRAYVAAKIRIEDFDSKPFAYDSRVVALNR